MQVAGNTPRHRPEQPKNVLIRYVGGAAVEPQVEWLGRDEAGVPRWRVLVEFPGTYHLIEEVDVGHWPPGAEITVGPLAFRPRPKGK